MAIAVMHAAKKRTATRTAVSCGLSNCGWCAFCGRAFRERCLQYPVDIPTLSFGQDGCSGAREESLYRVGESGEGLGCGLFDEFEVDRDGYHWLALLGVVVVVKLFSWSM